MGIVLVLKPLLLLTKTDYKKVKRIVFLKDVLVLSVTAFGGPEMHIPLFIRTLSREKKYISEQDILELNSLCQILPGPSSTQTLTAIAHKIGGPGFAFAALLIWILPSFLLMSAFVVSTSFVNPAVFSLIGPMALGFIVMAALQMSKMLKKNRLSVALASMACLLSVLFHTPLAFPLLLIAGAFTMHRFGPANFKPNPKPVLKIKWANLTLMLLILISVALLGAFTKHNFPAISQPARLFENTYRMGSMVFGGGNVLYSMILTEFVQYKPKQYLSLQEFNTGLGLLQAVPGPTFSIATFANGLAMKHLGYGIPGQLAGCGLGTLAVFLPGTLLIFFVYPIWNQIKDYPIIYRSLDGIISVSIGFIWAAAIFMILPYVQGELPGDGAHLPALLVFVFTLLYLQYRKLPAALLVAVTILAGYLLYA